VRLKSCWPYLIPLLALWFLLAVAEARGASALAGRLIDFQGQVVVARGGTEDWQAPEINQELFAADAIRTGPDSRAAILCADESQIKLNENTVMVLKSVASSSRLGYAEVQPAAAGESPHSLYRVLRGEIWLRNNKEKFPFAVETPAVTAAIRGTEFNLRVSRDGASYLTLLSGSLEMVNDHGQVVLQPGEEGMARPGQAPTKRVIVQPADAVQWSLYYPGIFSFRDLPLTRAEIKVPAPSESRAAAGLVSQAEASYDQGHLGQAQTDAEAALKLDPRQAGALTVLGWLSLQQQKPKEAEEYFLQVSNPDDRVVVGLALSRYRLGDVPGAYRLLQEASRRLPSSPLLSAMTGFMALMAGKVEEAGTILQAGLQQWPRDVLARCLLAQIQLVQNRKDQAKAEAAQALNQAPASPLAQLTMALVNIAYFDLPAASQHLQQALTADPRFVTAYVYLAKIQLGGDYLNRASDTIHRALKLAPDEAEVLTLAGFVRLAFRDFDEARQYFERAVKANPGLGEPHLGLGIYAFRYRQMDRGLAEMLTATLLEPRISLYQSELGKALYQVRAFDKALQVYDYAKTLDKNDPTPYLYKGIALTDLNRPAEAVQEINKSIALNDNQAIFRSRIMLDRDQSVGNYNLARAYTQLGLGEWAYSKAVTSVKKSPTNPSAYAFLTESYVSTQQLYGASQTSLVLYYLLSPANQNTYSVEPMKQNFTTLYSGSSRDYTPMFEMPYWRALAQGGIGSWEKRKPVQEHSVEVYGGMPGLAFDAAGFYNEDKGFRDRNSDNKDYTFNGQIKWDPTVQHSLTGNFTYFDLKSGDDSNLNDFKYINRPLARRVTRERAYVLGYVHRFNPNATFIAYYSYSANDQRGQNLSTGSGQLGVTLPPISIAPGLSAVNSGFGTYDFKDYFFGLIPHELHNAQFQQQLILGDHTFMGGFDYFTGHLKYRTQELQELLVKNYFNQTTTLLLNGNPILTFLNPFTQPINTPFNFTFNQAFQPPDRSYTFYLVDYWKIRRNLLLEMGLFKDIAKSSRLGLAEPIYNNKWSPRLGINYLVNDTHTLRLALMQHVNSHFFLPALAPSLVPPEVASFPWQANVEDGSRVREAGASWEAQWNNKAFTVLRLDARRVSHPTFAVGDLGETFRVDDMWKQYAASFTVNRIIGQYFGLTLGGTAKKFDPNTSWARDFKQYDAFTRLVFWHPSGWWTWVNPMLIKQDLMDRGDNLFGLVNAAVGYEFPGKRGMASLEVDNLLNRHFFFEKEIGAFDTFFPVRRIMFKLALYF
jgi:tetratricopeptide (TPR) repeat protein